MALRQTLAVWLLCLAVATADEYVAVSGLQQPDPASAKLAMCQFSQKELHTTVRSAAVAALSGICDPVEMEARLLGIEQRLSQRIEQLKQTLTKLFIEGVAYDYDEEGESALEQHRYTGAAASTTASVTAAAGSDARDGGAGAADGEARLTQGGGFEAYNRIETAADQAARRHGARGSSASYHQRTASSSSQSSSGTSVGVTGEGSSEASAAIGAADQEQRQDRRSSSAAAQEKVRIGGATDAGTTTSTSDGASVAAGAQDASSRSSSSRSYSYKQTSSSRGSSGVDSADQTRGAASSQEVGVEQEPGQHDGSHGSSTHRHSYERRTSSSRGTSGVTAAGEDAQQARAIGGDSYSDGEDSQKSGDRRYVYARRTSASSSSQGAAGARAIGGAGYSEGADSQQQGTPRSESQRHSNDRRTSAHGSSRGHAEGRSHDSRAIGGASYSEGASSQFSGGTRSSSRRFSQERASSSRGSSGSSSEDEEAPYVDFGPGGGPEQHTWYPGSSRTTAGTGVPDLPRSTSRTGGFGFGAVGEPLDEDSSSGASSGAQVHTGGATYTAGGGGVLFRDGQTYVSSAESRRPGSTAGGDSRQYAAQNASWASSGERQVSAYDATRTSRRGGAQVRYESSYTPIQSEGAYSTYNNQQSGASNLHRSRHSGSRSRTGRRRAWRRRQRVTDTVSSISGEESAPLSRYFEIEKYNDTVYEVDGKKMFSYYWEVNDLPTMMTTWEHHHSLRSPSFYVYQGGYRMYIRVFPSRQGGNVYLHTGLTQGRYDAQLPWPFQLRLRLSLLDHSNLQHDIRSRVWDPRKLCSGWNWKRPSDKDNFECVGLGFPQSLLETQRFLMDGAVLIKLDVFLED